MKGVGLSFRLKDFWFMGYGLWMMAYGIYFSLVHDLLHRVEGLRFNV